MTRGPQLSGRRVVITGAASGMGLAIARLFAAEGAATVLIDVNAAKLGELEGSCAAAIAADVSSPEAIKKAIEKAADVMEGIDGVVNAAGILRVAPFAETGLGMWREIQDVNLLGPYLICQAALPYLQAAERATIVNISSLAGLIAPIGMTAYAASKGGLIAFTKVLAAELGPKIRANVIAPGGIRTPMTTEIFAAAGPSLGDRTALRRVGEPEEIAQVALFLTSDQSSFVTGTVTAVDGGSSWH